MDDCVDGWVSALHQQVRDCERESPVPDREGFSEIEEWQCRIVGGALIAWLRQHGPKMLQERAVMAKMLGVEKEPVVVFTSDNPGLAAAREILDGGNSPVVAMRERAYRDLLSRHPDEAFRWHVHHWSYFTDSDDRGVLDAVKRKYPIASHCTCWFHVEGTSWAPQCGGEGRHLWKWDGDAYELLEEAFSYCQF